MSSFPFCIFQSKQHLVSPRLNFVRGHTNLFFRVAMKGGMALLSSSILIVDSLVSESKAVLISDC